MANTETVAEKDLKWKDNVRILGGGQNGRVEHGRKRGKHGVEGGSRLLPVQVRKTALSGGGNREQE